MSTAELFEAFESNPSDHRTFESLIKELLAESDRDTLQAVYERIPELAEDANSPLMRVLTQQARKVEDPELASFLHYWNGWLLWQHFGDHQKADMAFRKLSTAPPDPASVRQFFLDYYTPQRNWRRLEQLLTDPSKGGLEDEVEAKRMLGRLAEEHGDPERAIQFWQGVRQAMPEDAEARDALERLYKAAGKWHAMVELLREELKQLDDDRVDDAIALHRRMIDIYKEHLNAPSKVIAAWQAILELDPGNREALDALSLEYEGMKRWPDLVKVLQQKIEHEDDVAGRIELHRRIASIMEEKFSNSTEAIKHYEAILDLAPEDREAIGRLKEIYEQRRDWDQYIQVAEREIGLLDDEAERREAFLELARLASQRIRKPATPIALWERVREGEPDHPEALAELETLYERDKQWDQLATVRERRVEQTEDPEERKALLEKLGQLYTSRIDEPERATEAWRRLLELDPDHRKAEAELKKKYLAQHDWDGLEWLLRTYDSVQEWVRTLESQAKNIEDTEEKTQLRFRAAKVWQEELGEVRRAVKDLEAVLQLSPHHVGAAERLVPIYRELKAWKKLPPVYDILLEATEDPTRRRELLLELATVQEEQLRNVDAAFFAYVQATRETPNEASLYPELQRLAERSGNWEPYVVVLHEVVDLIEDPQLRVQVLLDTGRVYRDRLRERDEALDAFRRVVELDDRQSEALDALEQLHGETGAHDQVLAVLDQKLRMTEDPSDREELLFRTAEVWRRDLRANEEAEAVYARMLQEYPGDVRIHQALIDVYLDEGRHEPIPDVLAAKRDVLADAGAPAVVLADLECELGMLAWGLQPDEAGASAAVTRYETALAHEPDHEETVARLEELLPDEGQQVRIARVLEPVYRRREAWERLAQALEIQLREARERDDGSERISLLERLGELYTGYLADRDRAWRTWGRHLRLAPEREDVRTRFEEATEELDRWDQLVGVYDELADRSADPGTRLALKLEVARTLHRRRPDLEAARRYYHAVLDEDPNHVEALDALEEIYLALDRAEDLLEIYRRKVELAADTDQQLDYLFRISDLLRDRLERWDDAIAAAQEAATLSPSSDGALHRLDELYTRTERWTDLVATIEETLHHVAGDDERTIALTTRLAGVHESRLEDVSTAIELYARVMELDPDHELAVGALQRLFRDEEWAPTVAPLLQPYYDRHDDWRRLVDVHAVREAASEDVAEKVDWHYRIADLYERRGDEARKAFEHYALAANLDPGNEQTLRELLRLADDLEVHGELVAHLRGIVDDIDDDLRRRETHRTIAELARDRTADMATAEHHFRALLDIQPDDMAAVDALIDLYRRTESTDALVRMLLTKAPMREDLEERKGLYIEAGQLAAGELGEPERAVEIHETLHELDPSDDRALDALEGLYERIEDWERLVETYRLRIERTEKLDERKRYAALMAEVQAERQESLEDAVQTWRRVLEWNPQDARALDELDRLHVRQEDWLSLLDVLQQKQKLLDETGAAATAAEPGPEAEPPAEVDAEAGAEAEAVTEAEAGAEAEALPEAEAGTEAEALPEAEAGTEVEAVAEPEAAPATEGGAATAVPQEGVAEDWVEAQYRIAELYERDDRLGDPHQAIAACDRLLGRQPDHEPTLRMLSRLVREREEREDAFAVLRPALEAREAWQDLWNEYEVVASHQTEEPDRLVETLHQMVDLAELRLEDPRRAFEACARAFRIDPQLDRTIERVEGLADAHGLLEDLVQLYLEQAEEADDDLLALELRRKAGALLMDRLEEPERAIRVYRSIREEHPEHPETLDRLHRLYEAQGMPSELVDVLRQRADISPDTRERIQHLSELARVSEEQLERAEDAYEAYLEILDLDGRSDLAVRELRRLCERGLHRLEIAERLEPIYADQQAWDDLHALLELKLEAIEESVDRMEIMRQLAELNLERLERKPEALIWYGRAFRLDPDDEMLLERADTLAAQADRFDELQRILMDAAAAADEDERRVELWHRAARVSRDQLDDPDEAERIFRRVLELDDANEQALAALDDLLVRQERWSDLEPVLSQEAKAAEFDDDRLKLLMRLGELYRDQLERPDDAIAAFREVLDINDMHRPALQALEALYRSRERWEDLLGTLQQLAETAPDDEERRRRLIDQARLAEDPLGRTDTAIELWEETLTLAPSDLEGVRELERLLRGAEKWEALVDAYERELGIGLDDPDRRLELYKELGRLLEQPLDEGLRAQGYWEQARKEAPTDREALESLRRIYRDSYNFEALADVLEALLDGVYEDPDETLAGWRELAQILTESLVQPSRAIDAWEQVLSHAPEDREAIEQLEELYEQEERWADAVALQQRKGNLATSTDDRVSIQLRIATLQEERLEDRQAAAATLNDLLREKPGDLEASQRLEAIHEAEGDYQSLAEVLLERTDHLPDTQERLLNLQRLARVYEQQLQQPDGAFVVLQRAATEAPEDDATREELFRLAELTGLWEDLVAVYDEVLPHLEGDAALEVWLQAAKVVRERMQQPEQSIAYFERALEVEEDDETALRALVDVHQELERWEALVGYLRRLADVAPDYGERAELLRRVARVQEQELGDQDSAVRSWYAVLDVDELDRESLQALERLHAERGEWNELIEILRRIEEVDPERGVELNLRVAEIFESHLDRIDDAIERYEEVLTFEPGNTTALERLEGLYGDREDWGKLVEVYERSYDAARDDAERVEVCRKLALLQSEVFQDGEAAADWYHRILQMVPGDAESLDQLERIYEAAQQWDDLVHVHELRRESAPSASERATALLAMGRVHRDRREDVDDAIRTYQRVLEEQPDQREALDELEQLYRQEELWEQVIGTIEQKLEHETDPDARLELLREQGRIAREEMTNPEEAARYYARALAERPGWQPAVDALVAIYGEEERWDRVVETLQGKLEASTSNVERSRVHLELARVHRERLEDSDKALEHLEAAVEEEPESIDALWPLARHYMAREQPTKAMPLLDVLADRLEQAEDDERRAIVHKDLARCAEALLDDPRAQEEYDRAARLLPNDPEVLRGLGRLHYKASRWAEAEQAWERLVDLAGRELSDEDFLELHTHLGDCAMQLGQYERAKGHLSRVVQERPHDTKALEKIATVLEGYEDWDEAISYKERLVELLDDPQERFTVQMSIGDLFWERLGNADRAIEAYEAALELGAYSKAPMLQLVQIHAQQKNYDEAVKWLDRLVDFEQEPSKKALYAMSAAVMYRDQLEDPDRAVEYYNRVLDYDPSKLEAFRAIDELLTRLKSWKELERNYRRMIQRAQEHAEQIEKVAQLRFTLYKNLGEVYRTRLRNVEYAISSFELARQQDPKNEKVRRILADLYEANGRLDEAFAEHHYMVRTHPDELDNYHRLFQLLRRKGDEDRAWCVAGALATFDQADEEQLEFYRERVPPAMSEPSQPLDLNDGWIRWLAAPEDDPHLGEIFALLYRTLDRNLNIKSLKELNLRKKDRMDTSAQTLFATTLRTVCQSLSLPVPDVYRDDRRSGIEILPTLPPTLAVGPDMLSGKTDTELAFRIAKPLTYLEPRRVMAALYEHEHLDLMFLAASSLVDPNFQLELREDLPDEERQRIQQQVGEIRGLLDDAITPQHRKQLAQLMGEYWKKHGAPRIGLWHRHCELTANHAAVMMCGDIELAGRLLGQEVSGLSKLSRADKHRDLVLYVLTDRFAEMRRRLDLVIDPAEPEEGAA